MIAGSIAAVALFVSVGVVVVLWATDDSGRPQPPRLSELPSGIVNPNHGPEDGENGDGTGENDTPGQNNASDRGRTNFLLLGIDHNNLADAIMVGTFYRENGNIHLMSIPRDSFARLPQHRLEQMRDHGLRPPETMKINELRSHGGRVHGIYYLKDQIAEMLGISIQFYVEVQLTAFREIVDLIGPIEMHIPGRLYYQDPTATPPTNIDVPAGLQRLNGAMAEGVVRYRGWPMADLGRNQMQMEFMTLLIQQLLTREALLTDPMALIGIVLTRVNSNIGASAITYIPFIPRMSAEGIRTFTMPGTIERVQGREYFMPCTTRLPGVAADVFHYVFDAEDSAESDESHADEE